MTGGRTGRGPRGIAATLPAVTRGLFKKRGFAQSDVLTQWRAIVGDALADRCCPERLIWRENDGGATLRIRVESAWAPELQHLEPIVIERINTYFGYRAVGRLQITQGVNPEPARRQTQRQRTLTPEDAARLDDSLERIRDPELAAAFRALGANAAR